MKFPAHPFHIMLNLFQHLYRFRVKHGMTIFIICLLSFLFNVAPASAQTANPYTTPNVNPDVPKNLHTWTQNVMIEVMSSLVCQLSGVDPINPNQACLGVDQTSGKIGFVKNGGGAIAVMGNMITMLYQPPLHTGDYFQYLANNFGLAKPAYAQANGIGFKGLSPLMGLWTGFRNIVYLLFVIVFIVIGLAIMLRIKIDPRTVMSIENQIPKIIIGIVLVTFSFAIAGFLIDIMYVTIYATYGVIFGIAPNVSNLNPAQMQGRSVFETVGNLGEINKMTNTAAVSLKDIFQNMLGISGCPDIGRCLNTMFNPINGLTNIVLDPAQANVTNVLFNIIGLVAGTAMYFNVAHIPNPTTPILGDIVGFLKTGPGAFIAGEGVYAGTQFLLRTFLPWLIVYIIIFIAVLWALFRLWIELLKAYIFILLDVVLAPFYIVLGLFPGSPVGFGAWFRDILTNLSVFPVTIALFLVGKIFMDTLGKPSNNLFVPPLLGNPSGTGEHNLLSALVGIGMILLTPQVLTMMRDFLKAPQFKYTAGIGQAVGVGAGAINVGSHAQKLSQFSYQSSYLPRMPVFGKFLGRFIKQQ